MLCYNYFNAVPMYVRTWNSSLKQSSQQQKITPSIFDMKNYKPPVTTTGVPSAITIYHHYISKF